MTKDSTEEYSYSEPKPQGIHQKLKRYMGKPSKDEILEGNILLVMLKLGWPIMVATFLRTLYNLADTIWLGRLPGDEAAYSVAASSQAWSVVHIIMALEIGFGIAALALISQYTGSRDYKKASEYAGQLYFTVIVLSVILGAVGYFSTPYLLDLLTGTGADADALASYGTVYLQITFLGMPFMFLFFAFMFIMRGWGDNITPMKIVAVTATLNLIIDPVLILGSGYVFNIGPWRFAIPTLFGYSIPSLGIKGAAIATIATRGLAAVYSFYLMFSGKLGISIKTSYLRPDFKKIKKLLKVGIPASFGRFGSSFGFLILWAIIYRLPNPEVAGAAYGAGSKILNITFLVMGGITMAMATMIGQSLGADNIERGERVAQTGLITLTALMSVIAVVIFLARNLLIGFIVPSNPEVISAGGEYLLLFSLSMPFFGIFRAVTKILGGSGHTVQQMILNLTRIWGLRLTLVFTLAIILEMHSRGVWIGMALSNVIAAGIAMVLYFIGSWKKKIIEDKTKSEIDLDEEKGDDL